MSLLPSTLGRSISDALARARPSAAQRGYLEVDLGLIRPSEANPRQHFDEEGLKQLSASLTQHGMLEPIVVVRSDPGYEIVAGERRYRAAKLANWSKVPVVVLEEQDAAHLAELRLIENVQREDLNPVEIGRAYQALSELHGFTHERIAERVGQDRATVSNAIRILALEPSVLALVASKRLSLGHAKVLLGIEQAERQRALAEQAVAQGLSVRALEALIKKRAAPARVPAAVAASDPRLKEIEDNLSLLMKTRVTMVSHDGSSGNLTIHFDSKDQFDRVVAIMSHVIKRTNGA